MNWVPIQVINLFTEHLVKQPPELKTVMNEYCSAAHEYDLANKYVTQNISKCVATVSNLITSDTDSLEFIEKISKRKIDDSRLARFCALAAHAQGIANKFAENVSQCINVFKAAISPAVEDHTKNMTEYSTKYEGVQLDENSTFIARKEIQESKELMQFHTQFIYDKMNPFGEDFLICIEDSAAATQFNLSEIFKQAKDIADEIEKADETVNADATANTDETTNGAADSIDAVDAKTSEISGNSIDDLNK